MTDDPSLLVLLDDAPAAIAVQRGPELRFEMANAAFRGLLGGLPLVGKTLAEVLPDWSQLRRIVEQLMRDGKPYAAHHQRFLVDPEGTGALREAYFDLVCQPLRHEGAITGVLTFAVDVTAAVQARKRLEVSANELRHAVDARDEFLSVASHELKTPLTSLKLRVQGLIDQAPPVPDPAEALRLHKSFELAERQVRRLEKLINSLLDVSRIAVGRFPLQCEEVDLVSMVHSVVGQFSAEIARSGADILLDLPAHARGHWDPLRLEQVVVNLLSNALKYGAGKPIEIVVRCDDETALLTVRDHGIGIDAADQGRIFERFERAVSLNYGGLGLGLHIAREIVVAHHGTIHVESERGQGAAFVVAIPRGQHPPAELGEAWTHA
jgi:signal transduction histidine kinase